MHPDINAKDLEGFTPLHTAVMRDQFDIVARLLNVGAKVDEPSKYGDRPLNFVKSRQIAELLLAHKANINGVDKGKLLNTPLHSAAFYGRTEVAELLIERGANMNSQDTNGDTPLHRAAFAYSRNSLNTVRLLIEKGANMNLVNYQGKRPVDMGNNIPIKTLIHLKMRGN